MPVLPPSISSAVVMPTTSGAACTGEELLEGEPMASSWIGATWSMAVVLTLGSAILAALDRDWSWTRAGQALRVNWGSDGSLWIEK